MCSTPAMTTVIGWASFRVKIKAKMNSFQEKAKQMTAVAATAGPGLIGGVISGVMCAMCTALFTVGWFLYAYNRAQPARRLNGGRLVYITQTGPVPGLERDIVFKLGLRHALFATNVIPEFRHIAELPLPRRVIHDRQDTDPVVFGELGQFVDQGLGTDFGPQVQEMADPENAARPDIQQFARQGPGVFVVIFAGA